MRFFLPLLAASVLLPACHRATSPAATATACATPATIRDLKGLDGCGFVLELATGKRLEPHGPLWQQFPKAAGARVTVTYAPSSDMSVCMAGQPVLLSCIEAAGGQ